MSKYSIKLEVDNEIVVSETNADEKTIENYLKKHFGNFKDIDIFLILEDAKRGNAGCRCGSHVPQIAYNICKM